MSGLVAVLSMAMMPPGLLSIEAPVDVSCEGAQPLFLREPLQQLANVPPDANTDKLLAQTFPRIDSEWFFQRWSYKNRKQVNASGSDGYQYPDWPSPVRSVFPEGDPRSWLRTPRVVKITSDQASEAAQSGLEAFEEMQTVNEMLQQKGVRLSTGDASYTLQQNFRKQEKLAESLATSGFISEGATSEILSRPDIPAGTSALDLQATSLNEKCRFGPQRPEPESCDPYYPYRKIDGTCNNLENPIWGSSFTPFRRLLPHMYSDGVSAFRRSVDGSELPSARLISSTLNVHHDRQSSCFSILHMTYGQYLDHDLTATPLVKGLNGSSIPCCTPEVQKDPELHHPACATINIPQDDPLYAAYGITCMEFVRSLPCPKCGFGPREQINDLTSFVDGSAVYGSQLITSDLHDDLRTYKDGLLKMQVTNEGEEMLAASEDRNDSCNIENQFEDGRFCFKTGDSRVNENVLLVLLTTLWARLHNYLARDLKHLNPHWDDTRLYEEARRIMAAMFQHVTYNEFLTGVLGTALMTGLGLAPQKDGAHTTNYNPNVHPAISSEFATAAFRFGHSMVTTDIFNVEVNGNTKATELSSTFFNPFDMYYPGTNYRLLRGGMKHHAGEVEFSFTDQISGKLFRNERQYGLDLIALNIQRGRDHGLSNYVSVRQACGLSEVTVFSDLKKDMRAETIALLQGLYRYVGDIDLFVGGLSERPLPGAQVGPTFACIIADQFLRLKIGDRFWYEYRDSPGAFTTDQLRMVHGVSLARIICDTFPEVKTILRWPLQLESAFNPKMSCSSSCIPKINLDDWKDY